MRGLGILTIVFGVGILGIGLAPSLAQTPSFIAQDAGAAVDAATDAVAPKAAKRKSKPKPRKPKAVAGKPGPGQLLVVNNRAVGLRQLTLTSTTAPGKSGVVAKALAAGAKAIGKVPTKAGCEFSVAGEFDDGVTLELDSVEVCKDRTLNLVE